MRTLACEAQLRRWCLIPQDLQRATALFSEMVRCGVERNVHTYTALVIILALKLSSNWTRNADCSVPGSGKHLSDHSY